MNKIALLITRIALICFKTPNKYYMTILGPLSDAYKKVYLERKSNA